MSLVVAQVSPTSNRSPFSNVFAYAIPVTAIAVRHANRFIAARCLTIWTMMLWYLVWTRVGRCNVGDPALCGLFFAVSQLK